MKRLVLLVGLALLTVVGTTATSQAYYLDTPHNESNGIYCFTCHAQMQTLWFDFTPTADPDYTLRNQVCLTCHGQGATHPNKGPAKKLHASSTNTTELGTWTTECTQCHDVHSQGQLDYAGVDDALLFLANGTYNTVLAAQTFNAADPAGGSNCGSTGTSLCGTTTVGISATITATAPWDDTTKWGAKGGFANAASAFDNSRGLVLVADKATLSETYEIISVVGNVIKVKGRMDPLKPVANGQPFGVIYGNAIKSYIMPNGGTTIEDMRDIKFFQPALIDGDAGGYVDLTPATTAPQGLCQACHTSTTHWLSDGTDPVPHGGGQPCNSCHNVIQGAAPEVIQDHTTYIGDTTGCGTCHSAYVADPDSSHVIGCINCHVVASPNTTQCGINSNQIANEAGGVTVLGSILNGGYTYVSRIADADGTDIKGVGGDAVFTKIDCGECHESKPGKVTLGTHGGHSATDFTWDGNCADCHGPTSKQVVRDIHGNGTIGTCTICHDPASVAAGNYTVRRDGDPANGIDGTAIGKTTASTCTGCHSVNTPAVVHHTSANNYAVAGNCTFCHVQGGSHGGNHSLLVSLATNCADCHTGNQGTATGIPVDATDATVAARKIHDSCISCHNTDSGATLKAAYGVAQAMPNGGAGSNNGGGSCEACHTSGFGGYHATVGHATTVNTYVNCSVCHTGTAGTTGGIPLSGADNKVHDGCTTCHLSTTGRLTGSASGKNGGTNGGSDAVNTCATCHGEYFASHTNINHTAAVSLGSTTCGDCHIATAGTATTVPVSGADNKVHDACSTCHAATGVLVAPVGSAVAMPNGGDNGGTNGGGSCATCHGATYFTVTHSSTHDAKFYYDTTGTGANVDILQNNGSAGCATCHNDAGTSLATFAAIKTEHLNNCDMCHAATRDINETTATGTTVRQWIAARTAETTTDTNCRTCHVPNWTNNPNHAGHQATDFAWDATTQVTCGASGCHNYTVNTNVIGSIHGNTCTVCHDNAAGGNGTAIVGSATNGIDGNAQLANVTTHTDNCLVCHPTATYDLSTVHHTSKTGYAAAGNCVQCHTGTTYGGNHSTLVSLASNCADCHTGNQGTATGIPVDATDATVAARKLHDACITCHNTDADGTLKAAYGVAQAMPNGGAGSNNGGGSCEACHTAGFAGYHATVGHATTVNTYVNCSTCHTGTAGTTGGIPLSGADNKVHDACTTCHGADGRLIGSAAGKNGGTNGGSDATNTCATCHGEYFASHTNINHTAAVSLGSTTCGDCHIATAGTATTVPVSGADNKVHDACSTCHTATGVLVAPSGSAVAMPNGGDNGGTNGGGSCATCHGATYFTVTHSSVHDAKFYYDTTGTGASVDILQNNGSSGCASCHNDAGASLATFAAIKTEHLNNCDMCHAATRDINETTASGTTVRQWIAARTAETTTDTNCRTCHVPNWNNNPNHSGHQATDFAWDATTQASCGTVGCHNYTVNTNVIGSIHGNTCTICHDNAGGGNGTAIVGSATNGIDGNAQLANVTTHTDNCLVCHPTATYDLSTVHHDSKNGYAAAGNCVICHTGTNYPGDHSVRVSLAANCADCHTGNQGTATGIPVDATDATVAARKLHDACITCHNTDADATLKAAYGVAQAMPNGGAGSNNGGGSCEACHTAGFGGYHATVAHNTTVNTYVNCSTCHTGTAGTTGGIPTSAVDNKVHDACTTCHGADGRLIGSAAGKNGGTNGGSDAVNTCATCHGEYFASHTNINHTTMVSLGTTFCGDCHTATAGTATNVPVNAGDNKVHDACTTCHAATGILLTYPTAGGLTVAMPNGGTGGGKDGGGDCLACHGTNYFTNTGSPKHTTVHDAKFYYDTVGANNAKDVLQANGTGTGCANCHNDAGTALVDFAAIRTEHLNDCSKCHGATRDINETTASGTTVRAWIAARVPTADATETNCRTCHVPNWSNSPVHSTHPADFGKTASCTTTCHTGTNVLINIHGDGSIGTCTMCHNGSPGRTTEMAGSSTNGIDGDARMADGTAAASSWASQTCVTCHTPGTNLPAGHGGGVNAINAGSTGGIHHDNKSANITCTTSNCHTASKVAHTTQVATSTSCNSCHAASAGASGARLATTAPYVAGSQVHVSKGQCTACHLLAASPSLTGGLRTTGLPGGMTLSNGGTNTWVNGTDGGGNCTTCHGAYFSSHTTVNHSVTVSSTGQFCVDCHAGTVGTTTTVPVNASNNKIHDACTTCHASATGLLMTLAQVQALGRSPQIITAMVNGGTNGGTDGGGACSACHGVNYFTNSAAQKHTQVHDAKFYYDTTGTGASVDILQANGSSGCASCHNDAAAALATFAAIRTEHLDNCNTCHAATRDINETTASGTTVRAWIAAREAETTTDTNCRTCHVPNWSNSPNHAGHATSDFAWNATTQTTCGTAACHNYTVNGDVVNQIHKGNCLNCHSSASGGNGTAVNRDVGNATLANVTTHTDACTVCHTMTRSATHHGKTGSYADVGNCTQCHTDPRPTYAGGANIAYKQLACAKCHVVSDGGTGSKVVKFTLKDRADGANSTRAGNTQADVANHVWPKTTTTEIQNYGACFKCHGKTGTGATKKPKPFHALPTPSLQTQIAELGTAGVIDTNRIGGGGFQPPIDAGWSVGNDGLDYRGAAGALGGSAWTNTYFPIGKTVMNIGWALHSQPKKASNVSGYKQNNTGLYANTAFNIPAGMQFGVVSKSPNNADATQYVPYFDATPPAGVDTLTKNSATVTWTYTSGAGPITARTLAVNVSSSDNTATLSLVYGGRVIATGTNGVINTNVNLDTLATTTLDATNKLHVFHTQGAGIMWVSSNKGGSIKLNNVTNQGQLAN